MIVLENDLREMNVFIEGYDIVFHWQTRKVDIKSVSKTFCQAGRTTQRTTSKATPYVFFLKTPIYCYQEYSYWFSSSPFLFSNIRCCERKTLGISYYWCYKRIEKYALVKATLKNVADYPPWTYNYFRMTY